METLKIKCPFCGAVLAVKNKPMNEQSKITCPVCKEKSLFVQFKQFAPKEEHTEYASSEEHTSYFEQPEKRVDSLNTIIGKLKAVGNGPAQYYALQSGRNVIGRKSDASSANIQLPTGEGRRMSREHLVIEVKKVPDKGYVHYASLYKERINETFINDEILAFGDCIILKSGDKLTLPDATLLFEIPDEDGATL